jgi:hypothetical protein
MKHSKMHFEDCDRLIAIAILKNFPLSLVCLQLYENCLTISNKDLVVGDSKPKQLSKFYSFLNIDNLKHEVTGSRIPEKHFLNQYGVDMPLFLILVSIPSWYYYR